MTSQKKHDITRKHDGYSHSVLFAISRSSVDILPSFFSAPLVILIRRSDTEFILTLYVTLIVLLSLYVAANMCLHFFFMYEFCITSMTYPYLTIQTARSRCFRFIAAVIDKRSTRFSPEFFKTVTNLMPFRTAVV